MLFRLSALLSGLIFGVGVILSGMTNPAKIIGFLDVFGDWDPSLALVMGGAIAVTMPAFYLLKKRHKTLLNLSFSWSTCKDINMPLVTGSVLFGIGWGLAGLCPGPSIVALTSGMAEISIFAGAMLAGIALHKSMAKVRAG